jgi:ribosomal protein S12 methylthiotransferase accessory factor
MSRQPQFKPHYHREAVEGEGLFLVSESDSTVLKGRLYEQLAPLIDGRRGVDELIEELGGRLTLAEVYYTLAQLEAKGFVTEADDTLPANELSLWAVQGIDGRAAARRLAESRVSIAVLGEVSDKPLRAALRAARVRVGKPAQLGVVLVDDYLRPGLRAYNQEALRQGKPWLLVRPVGGQICVGPLFRPGQTACWECLAQRQRANRPVEHYLEKRKGYTEPLPVPRGSTAATLALGCQLAATAVAGWLALGKLSELEGKIVSLDPFSLKTQSHTLVRLPECPACGAAAPVPDRSAQPVVLTSRKKTYTEDGGHRACSPEETLQRFGHHVSPIVGAVSRLEPAPATDGVLHVYGAGSNLARAAGHLAWLRRDLRSGSAGKGITDLQARASGLCEALERHSGVFRGDEPRRRARFTDLGDSAIHPNDCMRFSDRQFADRAAWNARKSSFQFVPVSFDPQAEVEWTPLWSLTRQEVRYLPTALCYFAYPEPDEKFFCIGCSNGCAAGNTLEEAILQGFLELVERDAVACWWYSRVRRPAVDLGSFGEPYLAQLSGYLGERGRDLWVLDLMNDLGIPVCAALSRRTDGPERIMLGLGAHLDSRIAVLRAVTELNQMLAWVLPGENGKQPARTDVLDDLETLDWLQNATLENQPYLVPEAGAQRPAAAFPRQWTEDVKDDVLLCQAVVERHGLEMLVLDQTRSDIGLPVVKVVVPGLRHFWARFAPGRLYDVPVKLGWLPQPLREEELNPTPMFL